MGKRLKLFLHVFQCKFAINMNNYFDPSGDSAENDDKFGNRNRIINRTIFDELLYYSRFRPRSEFLLNRMLLSCFNFN